MIPVENIPACLKHLPQWVCWKVIERGGKPTKCPVNPATGGMADSTDVATWGTFEQALGACQADSLAGVGFVFTPEAGFCGVDLDDSIDPATNQLKPWAKSIVERLDSYTEVSPSGCGIKVFLRARKCGTRCRKAYEDGGIEMYDTRRFFTLTGRRLEGVSPNVEGRQTELDELYTAVFGRPGPPLSSAPPAPNTEVPALSEADILRLARRSRKGGQKFSALWNGHWNEHFKSPSEADSSVVFTLAFYTKDAAQIDRLFRKSALYRPKWDEKRGEQTYGERTIAKALEMVTHQDGPRERARQTAGPKCAPADSEKAGPPEHSHRHRRTPCGHGDRRRFGGRR